MSQLTISKPRLPYDPTFEKTYGVPPAEWRALTEAIYPSAKTVESVLMALSYCKARNLDPFKRPVHIVPVYDRDRKTFVDTIWPGIAEVRTTAMRTGLYAGKDKTLFGPEVTYTLDGVSVTVPEWAQITVYRLVQGHRCAFEGPEIHWLEYYARAKRDTVAPNDMWKTKPRSQLEKCAEAAALRVAFPEEIGGMYAAEEMAGQEVGRDIYVAPPVASGVSDRLSSSPAPAQGGFDPSHVDQLDETHNSETGEIIDADFEEKGESVGDAPKAEATVGFGAPEAEEPAEEEKTFDAIEWAGQIQLSLPGITLAQIDALVNDVEQLKRFDALKAVSKNVADALNRSIGQRRRELVSEASK